MEAGSTGGTEEPAAVEEARRALLGPRPTVPARWFWGEVAPLHRARARSPEHYPPHLDRAILQAHAGLLLTLARPRALIDLASNEHRLVRVLGDALRNEREELAYGLVDAWGARADQAVQKLSVDCPSLLPRAYPDLALALNATAAGGGRLLLFGGGGPDGLDAGALGRRLTRIARALQPADSVLVSVPLASEPSAWVRACADSEGFAEALHRGAFLALLARLGGQVEPESLRLEARWDPRVGVVETALRPREALTVELPALHTTLHLRRVVRTGRAAGLSRPRLLRLARAAGMELLAWLSDADARRALALLRVGVSCANDVDGL